VIIGIIDVQGFDRASDFLDVQGSTRFDDLGPGRRYSNP
jgi:hypothetical protein